MSVTMCDAPNAKELKDYSSRRPASRSSCITQGRMPRRELQARRDARYDVIVVRAQHQDQAVRQRHPSAGHGVLVGPLELLRQAVGLRRRERNQRPHRKKYSFHIADRAQLHSALPIQIEVQRTHHLARQIFRRVRLFRPRRTRLVKMIVHHEGEVELIREILDLLSAVPENRSAVFVDALEMVEKIARGHSPRQPETRAIGNGAVRDDEQPAFIVPNILVARAKSRSYAHGEKCDGQATENGNPRAHALAPQIEFTVSAADRMRVISFIEEREEEKKSHDAVNRFARARWLDLAFSRAH